MSRRLSFLHFPSFGTGVWLIRTESGPQPQRFQRHYFNLLPQKTTDGAHYHGQTPEHAVCLKSSWVGNIYFTVYETVTLTCPTINRQLRFNWHRLPGELDKHRLFQAARFKQCSLCTALQPNSTIATQQKSPERCQGSAVWTSVPLEFAVNLLNHSQWAELCSFTAVGHINISDTGVRRLHQTEKKTRPALWQTDH